MSEKQQLTPATYLGPAGGNQPQASDLYSYLKNQVMAPQYREGNLIILRATAIFFAGVAFVRSPFNVFLQPAI